MDHSKMVGEMVLGYKYSHKINTIMANSKMIYFMARGSIIGTKTNIS